MMDWQLAARGETGFDDDTAAACSRILRQCLRVGEKSRIGDGKILERWKKDGFRPKLQSCRMMLTMQFGLGFRHWQI